MNAAEDEAILYIKGAPGGRSKLKKRRPSYIVRESVFFVVRVCVYVDLETIATERRFRTEFL